MLSFKPLSLSDKETLQKIIGENKSRICENTPGLILSWDAEDGRLVCVDNDTLYLYGLKDGRAEFNYPVGGDERALDNVADFCRKNGLPLSFSYLSEEQKTAVEKKFGVICRKDRDWADYVYLADDLITLSGKKYHGQKNHVNRFIKDYPDHVFLPYEKGLIPDLLTFYEQFYAENQSSNKMFLEDKKLFLRILNEADDIGQFGGVLKVGDRIIAASFGEIVGDTLYVHYEKALREFSGSYAMINFLFANRYAKDVVYVNREEDCGEEGLRTAKLSLHPVFLAEKYFADIPL